MSNPPPPGGVVSFGPYEADLGAGQLRKRGRRIKLQEKPFLVLTALLEHAGDVVTRERLRERLWPDDTVVAFEDNLNTAVGKLRAALADSAKNPRYIETLPRRGYRFIADVEVGATGALRRIAVLPFENLSRDPEQEYFADGMTDAIITDLANIGAMTVISRTSVMQYKGLRKPLREIARELDVGAIVEGSVLRAGDRVRVTAQLIDAASDGHLWGESFDRDLSDVLSLQSELAHAVAREVDVQLSADETARVSKTRKVDPEAHEAYLKGRYCLNKRTEAELEKSIQYFERAIATDDGYAAVYSGLCDAYTLLVAGGYGSGTPEAIVPQARAAALRAIELDDGLADAHASLGFFEFKVDWDWPAAERAFRRALGLNPNYATAHHWYALFLMSMVRLDEALSEIRRAQELDPLSLIVKCAVGRTLHFANQLEDAVEEFRTVIELDSNFAPAHFDLGMTYLEMREFERAIEEFETALELSGVRSTVVARIGISYAEWGRRDEAREILADLERLSGGRYVSPYDVGELYLALGETDEAFRQLEKAYRDHDSFMIYLDVDPAMRKARSDPRFEALAKRMRFPRWDA